MRLHDPWALSLLLLLAAVGPRPASASPRIRARRLATSRRGGALRRAPPVAPAAPRRARRGPGSAHRRAGAAAMGPGGRPVHRRGHRHHAGGRHFGQHAGRGLHAARWAARQPPRSRQDGGARLRHRPRRGPHRPRVVRGASVHAVSLDTGPRLAAAEPGAGADRHDRGRHGDRLGARDRDRAPGSVRRQESHRDSADRRTEQRRQDLARHRRRRRPRAGHQGVHHRRRHARARPVPGTRHVRQQGVPTHAGRHRRGHAQADRAEDRRPLFSRHRHGQPAADLRRDRPHGTTAFAAPQYLDYRELYPWLLVPALLLLGAEVGLAHTVLRTLP